MKKKLFFLFITLFFLFSPPNPALADDEFNRLQQEYLNKYQEYRLSHQNYLTAKNKYLTYQTLATKTEALNATSQMLSLRDETLKNYLRTIRVKLSATANTTLSLSYFANNLYLNLDKEIAWLSDHQSQFSAAGNSEDLLKLSTATQERYPQIEVLIYQTLGIIDNGRLKEAADKTKGSLDQLETKINSIREEDQTDTTIPERWLLEAKNKFSQSQTKQNEIETSLKNLKANENVADNFQKLSTLLEEGQQYLKETLSYLLQTISQLRGEK